MGQVTAVVREKMEHICVGAILVEQIAPPRLLLAKRAPTRTFYPDVWDMIGGHCEPGETPEQTLARELEEEIGVTPTEWELLATLDLPVPSGSGQITLHVYVVTEWVGVPSNRSPEEHAAIAWFTVEEACQLALADDSYRTVFSVAGATARGERPTTTW